MSNVVIVGNANSIFIKEFCGRILAKEDGAITIISQVKPIRFSEFYTERKIQVIPFKLFEEEGKHSLLDILRAIRRKTREIQDKLPEGKEIKHLFVHFVEPDLLIALLAFWRRAKKKTLVFWGGDLYEISDRNKKILPFFLKTATNLVFMIEKQLNDFHQEFGCKYSHKEYTIDTGNALFDEIDHVFAQNTNSSLKDIKKQCKERFSWPSEKTIVTVGYNKYTQQQHIPMIQALTRLTEECKKKLYLVIPIAYETMPDEMFEELQRCLGNCGIDYCLDETFRQGEELATYRIGSDLFLYGQTTDAMSDSPLEYVYGRNLFVYPSWLKENYELLDKAQIHSVEYDDFDSLSGIMEELIEKETVRNYAISENSLRILQEAKAWNSVVNKWSQLL